MRVDSGERFSEEFVTAAAHEASIRTRIRQAKQAPQPTKPELYVVVRLSELKRVPHHCIGVYLYLVWLQRVRASKKGVTRRGFSYRELERLFGIARRPARRALRRLEQSGLITVKRGRHNSKPGVTIGIMVISGTASPAGVSVTSATGNASGSAKPRRKLKSHPKPK